MQNQVFKLVVRQITNNDFYDGFVKEFLNMIQKIGRNLDVRMIRKDNWHYWATKICCIFFQGMATNHEMILSMENAEILWQFESSYYMHAT